MAAGPFGARCRGQMGRGGASPVQLPLFRYLLECMAARARTGTEPTLRRCARREQTQRSRFGTSSSSSSSTSSSSSSLCSRPVSRLATRSRSSLETFQSRKTRRETEKQHPHYHAFAYDANVSEQRVAGEN